MIVSWKIVLFIYVGCCFESWLGRWRGGNCRRRSRKRNRDKVDKVVYYLVYFCRNGAYESISFLLISFRFDSLFITNNGEICEIFFFTVSYPVFIYSRILRLSKERTPFLLRSFEISPHPLKHPSIPPPCIQIPASAFPHYFFLLLFLSFFFTKIRRSSVFCEILSSKMPGQRKLRITVNETIQGLRDQNGHSLPLSESRKAHPPSSLFHRPIRASTSL